MNPYLKLGLKSFSVFVGAIALTKVQHDVTGQINLFDYLAVLWPALVALGAYWGGVADSTPAPWQEQKPTPPAGGTP